MQVAQQYTTIHLLHTQVLVPRDDKAEALCLKRQVKEVKVSLYKLGAVCWLFPSLGEGSGVGHLKQRSYRRPSNMYRSCICRLAAFVLQVNFNVVEQTLCKIK